MAQKGLSFLSLCRICVKSYLLTLKNTVLDFPGGTVVKNPPANAGDTGLSPGPGRSHMPQNN